MSPSIGDKAAYVRRAGQDRDHKCHWPGCDMAVPPAMWGCKPHWFALPQALRTRIWSAYRPGQEADGRPSPEYVRTARDVQAWIAAHQAGWAETARQQTLLDSPTTGRRGNRK